ncbi:MAG TPA: hypothetical protein VFP98_00725 [Candidatus Polarisedimenticolia bacterium]|nr:hypothetical protein [Candidatus Polarisedimenticolia bacterium]
MRRRFLALGLCLPLAAAGCVSRHPSHPHGMPPGQAKKMVHVHGAGCGHVFVDGAWIVVTTSPNPGLAKGKGK